MTQILRREERSPKHQSPLALGRRVQRGVVSEHVLRGSLQREASLRNSAERSLSDGEHLVLRVDSFRDVVEVNEPSALCDGDEDSARPADTHADHSILNSRSSNASAGRPLFTQRMQNQKPSVWCHWGK